VEQTSENIPDFSIDEIGESISKDLKAARVGSRPFFIISFSMGGVVSRSIILNQLDSNLSNLKGVLFISSPLQGSNIKDEVEADLGRLIPLYNSFSPFEDAITAEEFNQYFLDQGFPQTKVSAEIIAATNFAK
jgi:hypothetical protein